MNASPLIGLSQREQNIVANLVRYHRKQSPSTEDENFKSLPQKDRLIVIKLSVLLRLADSLDISHMENVNDVTFKEDRIRLEYEIAGQEGSDAHEMGIRQT